MSDTALTQELPVALHARSGIAPDTDGETASQVEVLNYALSLEHLEAAYYNEFLDTYSEHDVERSDVAKVFANGSLQYSTYEFIGAVRDQEEAHVETLSGMIEDVGGEPVDAGEYDFPYESVEEFAALSATIEAVGVSAYAGAAPMIEDDAVLAAALSIHSVEARHASYFSVLDTSNPFPNAFDPARSMDEVTETVSQFVVSDDGDESENAGEGELSLAGLQASTGSGNNPDEEYLEYVNSGDGPLSLTGWTVSNDRGTTYTFPDGFSLAPDATVRLYTGNGTDTDSELYWGEPEEVWNDRIDTMTVRNAAGEVVLERSYP